MRAPKNVLVPVLLLLTLGACSRKCVYRPGGTSFEDSVEDAVSSSPECEEVRSKYESCGMSGIFDAKFHCGPDRGECVASARARIKCRLADPEGYTCSSAGGGTMFAGMTPARCQAFSHLCTGVDKNTKPIPND